MAGTGYLWTAWSHCNNVRERKNQFKLVQHILKLKGFSKNQISKIQSLKKSRKEQEKQKKKFLATVKFNGCSNRRGYVKNFVRNTPINLDKYYLPMDIPDKNWSSISSQFGTWEKSLIFKSIGRIGFNLFTFFTFLIMLNNFNF